MTAQRSTLAYVISLCLLWALVPSLTFPNPPLDVVEGFAWGREMALGYTKHPPMQAWLLELSYRLTAGQTFGGYWLSQISLGLGYWCIWTLSRRLGLAPWQSFWSVVLTSATFYFTMPTPEFNPNILQIPVWAGLILFFHRALDKGHLLDWIVLGLIAAFGLYTKYFVALIIGTIGLYALVFPTARRCLATPGPWMAASLCLLLTFPHALWLVETDFLTLKYAAGRSQSAETALGHLFNPLNFLGAQIGNHAGLLLTLLAGLSFSRLKTAKQAVLDRSATSGPQNDRFLIWFAVLPLAILLLASAATGNEFEHMWGTPLFVLSGIMAVSLLHLPDRWTYPKRAFAAACTIQLIFLGIIFGQAVLEPLWKTKYTRLHYPGRVIAEKLTAEWQNQTGGDLAYVAGDMWSASNVSLHAQSRPSMFYLHDLELSPWVDINDVQTKGVLLVWRGERKTPPEELARFYPGLARDGTFSVPAFSYGTIPPVIVNWSIIKAGHVFESSKRTTSDAQ